MHSRKAVTLSESTLYAMIMACEAGFWVVLCCALALRYIFRLRVVSWFCLLSLPLIDIALLALTVLDLRRGASATMAHGLATAYIGFTVAFGSTVIGWVDGRFAQKFGGDPRGIPLRLRGWADVRRELELWARCLLAAAITCALVFAIITLLHRPDQTRILEIWYRIAMGTAFFWFLFGPLWSLVFFKREPATEELRRSGPRNVCPL
jgi:hypothetical protein